MLHYDPQGVYKAEVSFPIRLALKPPSHDLGEAHFGASQWLAGELEVYQYALIPADYVWAVYFRRLEDASRFLSEFPDLVLAGPSDPLHEYPIGTEDRALDRRFGTGTYWGDRRMAEQLDYNTLSRAELMKLRADLDKAIAAAGDREKRAALKAAEVTVREHGFSLADLMTLMAGSGRGKGRRGGGAGAAEAEADVRYRNPENPDQTWSGRGRRPAWYSEALAAGRPVEDLKAG